MKRCLQSVFLIALVFLLVGCPETTSNVPSLRATPAAVSLSIGETQRLTVTSSDPADTFTFSSNAPGIVSVSVSGLLTGVSEGNTVITITASNSGLTETVPAAVPGAMTVTPTAVLLRPSRSALLRAESSNPQDSLVWTSANRDIAIVNNAGLVTGVSIGDTMITVRGSQSGSEATAFVTIAGSAGVGIDVTPAELVLRPAQSSPLTANSTDEEDAFTWSSSNPDVATIDENGMVTAIAEGAVHFNVTGSKSRASGVALGYIVTQPLAQITINPTELVLRPDRTAIVMADSTESTDEIIWSSSDSNVATIGAGGRVNAIRGGRAFLIAEGTQSGATSTASLTVLGDAATRVTLSPSEIVLRPTQQASLTPLSSNLNDTFGWTSTDEGIATVDENGRVTAIAEGEATIVATGSTSNVSSTSLVSVVGRAPATISVNPSEVVLRPTRITKLEALSTDPEDTFTWSSSDDGVAVIDGDGVVTVTAIAVGEVTVIATGTASNDTGSAMVVVAGLPPATLTIDPGQLVMRPTRTAMLRATSSEPQDIIRWSSSDASVVRISSGGLLTAMAEGTATITAVGSLTDATTTAQITVEGREPANISIDPDEITLRPTRSTTLTATSANSEDAFTWSSSNDAVATVSSDGRVTAIATGQANIVATGTVSAEAGTTLVTVEGTPPASITIDPESIVIQPTRTSALTASSSLADDTLSWSSSDESIATVTATGMVTGVAEGLTTVTATGSLSGATNSTQVTVSAIPPAKLEVTPPGLVLRPSLTALLNATSTDILDTFIWTSSDETVATVDTSGKVTALTEGVATITATGSASSAMETARVTVSGAEPADITVSPDNIVLRPTLTLTLDVNSTDEEDEFTWTSSSPGVATIDAVGMVTAIAEGQTTITAVGSHSGDRGSTLVTVSGTEPSNITLTPNNVVLRPTRTATLVASSSNTEDVFSWSSSNNTVATVDATGTVTALTAGETTIVASGSVSQATGTARISVSGTRPVAIDITPVGIELKPTQTVVLVANSTDLEDAFLWESTNTNVAVVEPDGTVSAVEEGETTVTAVGTHSSAIGSAVISVSGRIPTEIGVVPATRTLRIRETAMLVATSNNLNDTFTWSSSNNTIATVNANGLVTGVKEGQVTVAATGSSSGVTGMAVVTIAGRLPAVINITPTVNVLRPTQALRLTATSTDSTDTFTWATSDSNVASITPDGVVAAVIEGEVTVTATGTNSGDRGTTTVTVSGRAPAEISISPVEPTVRPLQTTTLSATSSDPTDIIIWTVEDEAIATAEHNGTIRGLTVGETQVIATGSMSGDSASVTLRVAGRPFAEIVVDPVETALRVGEVGIVTASSTDTEDTFTWTSSNTTVATVLPDGSVVANAVGVTQLTATGTVSGDSGMGQVTVGSAEVTLTSKLLPLHAGTTETMEATSTDPNDRKFTWTSSNPNAAIVSPSGVVLGVEPGVTTIRAVGNVSGSAGLVEVTVVPAITSFLLWDGESGYSGEYGRLNTTEAYRGDACFEGIPDPYHTPAFNLSSGAFRADISDFDEIWFFAKVSRSGDSLGITARRYPNSSNRSNSQSLTDEYQLVRIPIEELRTTEYQVDSIERLHANFPDPDYTRRFFIDDVYAVSLAPFDEDAIPVLGESRGTDFGSVVVREIEEREIVLTNIGTKSIAISSLTIFGADAGEFGVDTTPFSIAPQESQTVTVSFSPTSVLNKGVGDKFGELVLAHDLTPFGSTTSLPLSGRAVSPAIEVSTPALQFGSASLGNTLTKTFDVTNTGNATLQVTGITPSSSIFQPTPTVFDLAPGDSQSVSVMFAPTEEVGYNESLVIASNAPDSENVLVDVVGVTLEAGQTSALAVTTTSVTSSTISLRWPKFNDAMSARIFLGPEPATSPTEQLPMSTLMATLGADASSYRIEGLAPAVDTFMQVELYNDQDTLIARGSVHAKTLGGPRAPLDTPVREVHMFSPNTLQIIIADLRVHSFTTTNNFFDRGLEEVIGDSGALWQEGPWTVNRQDGSPIDVVSIFRESNAVGQNYYETGYNQNSHDNLLDVDHSIFLVLAENVGTQEMLSIVGPTFEYHVFDDTVGRVTRSTSAEFLLPFSDKYLETPVMQVNQVGYSPQSTVRYAYLSGWMGDGGPLALSSFPTEAEVLIDEPEPLVPRRAIAGTFAISQRASMDPDAGTEVAQIDLADAPHSESDRYRVRIPGVGVSWQTGVSDASVHDSYYVTMRGLFHNRFGRDLDPAYTDWSPRPPDHQTVYTAERHYLERVFPQNTPLTGQRFLMGGHHDAGDFDIFPTHYTMPLLMMRAYEMYPEAFLDADLNIPESGNGIPDLLDEVVWSLAAWMQLQEPDGGVRAGVESYRHPLGIYFADEDPLPFWTFSVDAEHTARMAGLFAQASRLLAPFDPLLAEDLATRAEAAYQFAYDAGLRSDGDTEGGQQGEMLYAESELYGLTSNPEYAERFEKAWVTWNRYGGGIFDSGTARLPHPVMSSGNMIDYAMGYLHGDEADPAIESVFFTRLRSTSYEMAGIVESRFAFRNPRLAAPGWGKGVAVGEYIMNIFRRISLGDLSTQDYQAYVNAISLSADYVLGCNELGRVWLTGLGSRPPQDPLHLDSLTFIQAGKGPIPGIPVYGPSSDGIQFGNNVTYPPLSARAQMRKYTDIHFDVRANEFELTVQASQAQLFAALKAVSALQ